MEWIYKKLQSIRPKLVRYAADRLNDYEEVSDSLAETYLAIVEYMERHAESIPPAWMAEESEAKVSSVDEDRFEKLIFTILKRRIIDKYRTYNKMEVHLASDRPAATEVTRWHIDEDLAPHGVLMLQIAELVGSIALSLDDEDRLLLRQEKMSPLSNRQRVRLNRIRQKLRKAVLKEF